MVPSVRPSSFDTVVLGARSHGGHVDLHVGRGRDRAVQGSATPVGRDQRLGLGLATLYFHLDEPRVAAGDVVTRGQTIGTVGATGRVTGPHLHFGVLWAGARVDPLTLLAIQPPPAGP